jgi:hypothetical protein
MALSRFQMFSHVGRIQTVNMTHVSGPAGYHTSQPDLAASYKGCEKTGVLNNYFVTGKDDKAFFSIPSDTITDS